MHLNFFDVILIFRIDSNLCRPLGRAWWSAVSPLAPLGRGLRLAACLGRQAGSLGRSLASSLVARASAAFAAYAGSASSAPAFQTCGYRLCLTSRRGFFIPFGGGFALPLPSRKRD